MARKNKDVIKHAIRNRLTGEVKGEGTRRTAATKGHPNANLKTGVLKKRAARAFGDLQQLREQGNERGVKHAKGAVNRLRHQLTTRLLGGTHGEGFNPGLSQPGQHKATRQLLKAKLGNKFGNYYYTGGGGQENRGTRAKSLGTVNNPGPPQRTNLPHGGYLGPPNRRRRSGYGGY